MDAGTPTAGLREELRTGAEELIRRLGEHG
jgi:hypothetical protein